MPDQSGGIHTIANRQQPTTCLAKNGLDCLDMVSAADLNYWVTDLMEINMEDIQDEIVLEFPKPKDADMAKILVRAEVSELLSFAFHASLDDTRKAVSRLTHIPSQRQANPSDAASGAGGRCPHGRRHY